MLTKEEMKEAAKEAIKEWLDYQFTLFGRHVFKLILSALLVAALYMVLKSNGWSLGNAHLAQ